MHFAKKPNAPKQLLKLTLRRRMLVKQQRARFIASLRAPVSPEAKQQEVRLVERARAAKEAPFLEQYRLTA